MSLRLIVGTILLITNQPIGWGGMLLFGNLARRTGKKLYYFIGVGIYALSWGMLGLGVYLVGKEYADKVLNTVPRWVVITVVILIVSGYILYGRWKKNHSQNKKSGSETSAGFVDK